MHQYIMTLMGGAVITAFAELIAPSQWQKYTRIVTGFIMLALILAPIPGISLDNALDESAPISQAEYTPMPELVADELKRRVEEDARERIKSEYGKDCTVKASVDINDDGLIERVDTITVTGAGSSADRIRARLYEVYGARAVIVSD